MNNNDFTSTFTVDQSTVVVFNAINNVNNWWQGKITGDSHQINDEFVYNMMDFHISKQRVVELIPFKKVVWLITESNLTSFTNHSEWTGTKVIFEISADKNKTQLLFTHQGLVPKFECYGDCSGAWSELIQKSLFSLITTGKGVNVFN
ncbi:MAG: SRPBCC domain-containing protein [Chitinophagales bacterium]|nr:SRPBCC domain-containing protein [Chitinophagales bacterium]